MSIYLSPKYQCILSAEQSYAWIKFVWVGLDGMTVTPISISNIIVAAQLMLVIHKL